MLDLEVTQSGYKTLHKGKGEAGIYREFIYSLYETKYFLVYRNLGPELYTDPHKIDVTPKHK
jgi:hypothetical protein